LKPSRGKCSAFRLLRPPTLMKKRSSFGMRCVRCDYEIIAPHKTELLTNNVIRHLSHCHCCNAYF
jgi:hypothetical protein